MRENCSSAVLKKVELFFEKKQNKKESLVEWRLIVCFRVNVRFGLFEFRIYFGFIFLDLDHAPFVKH